MMKRTVIVFLLLLTNGLLKAQEPAVALWHGKERKVHYLPEGTDFVCVNPTMRFNRALYGTNTGFRVEAGDLPEFAMYMPGMGGNLQFALQKDDKVKWLIKADSIRTVYRAGSMIYEIRDVLLGNGKIYLTILALSNAEGLVLELRSENVSNVQLVWIYGGASGKKFSRDGDIGADPESSFYLKPENCADNRYQLLTDKFQLSYGTGKVLTEEERYEIQTKPESQLSGETAKDAKRITGYYPSSSTVRLLDAADPGKAFEKTDSAKRNFCITGKFLLKNRTEYFILHNAATAIAKTAAEVFADAESARKKLAGRIKINTPDNYLNTLGPALSVAADGIWEEPTYMHGAIAWRMRLPGWRGTYVADPLGWHDRARMHFDAYARSQLTTPATSGVVMDTALNLARHLEKVGTQLFSDGYITRNPNGYAGAHHYDMNLGFIDQLLNHFNYTGDTAYVKKMWPLLKRHLAWEKKNFDADGDGLYDAYAAIWASDALQYSGGGVTHSSAYNYRANLETGKLAKLIAEDGTVYEKEAKKILAAINKELWMPDKGWYAEYKDLLGNKLLHPAAALWTIYHAIDSKVPDPFQAYQSLRYIDKHIPHIPVIAKGWKEKDLYLLSETNWQPYTWSLNNVVYAENLHTALAYWQGNRSEEAFKLWRSAILETMYLSAGPGNFQQLSFYDAIRGELYRDFADGIGMTARSLMEGLFGIMPDALNDTLRIRPGLPDSWDKASVSTPDISFSYSRSVNNERYEIKQTGERPHHLQVIIPARYEEIASLSLNDKPAKWKVLEHSMGKPGILLEIPVTTETRINIVWKGNRITSKVPVVNVQSGKSFQLMIPRTKITGIYDPGAVLGKKNFNGSVLMGTPSFFAGQRVFFCKLQQGKFQWWQPVELQVSYKWVSLNLDSISFVYPAPPKNYSKVDLSQLYNDSVAGIFKNRYLSPRPVSPTLQLPLQGIGNWAYHSVTANISDSGLRKKAEGRDEVSFYDIPYATPAGPGKKNIIFTSMWDNFPDAVIIPADGKAKAAHLLMAGSTNPMQSRLRNGVIVCNYTDGSADSLDLVNPENWWPIEQDYYKDDHAFQFDEEINGRVLLKTGELKPENYKYSSIRGLTNFAIDGGAATLLQFYLDEQKEIKNFVLRAVANDVVIGLMSLTLER